VAVNCVPVPLLQYVIADEGVKVMLISPGFCTLTRIVSVVAQPCAFVPVTVYKVVTVGFAIIEAPEVVFKPAAGLQV